MKRHGDYVPLTQEQITAAQHTDIAEFLRARGEKLRREGSHYIWKEHDSCVITGYMWYQNSSGKHGAAVSFVQHFFGMSFPQAVLALLKDQQLNLSVTGASAQREKGEIRHYADRLCPAAQRAGSSASVRLPHKNALHFAGHRYRLPAG